MKRKEVLEQLAKLISSIRLEHPVRVGIDGVDASGKTTLANELAEILTKGDREIIRASIDGFHNPKEIRYQRERNSAEGYYLDSFNHEVLINQLLKPLGPNGNLEYKESAFDFLTDSKVETKTKKADRNSILLFEGVFLFRPELNKFWDYRMFVDVGFNTTIKRAAKRDQYYLGSEQEIINKYRTRYIPGQKLYLTEAKLKEKANVIINNSDFETPSLSFN